ncbi:site-specific integrase [Pseudoalteromonas sp. PAR1]|uniref:site-specific integrase n=1 Tax=Pseudoalteromonas sp. PAR1 TaxID=2853443 RepID=UPI00248B00E3|nr:site-specific integrase [Pseudoalteromonas sp. PAR1]
MLDDSKAAITSQMEKDALMVQKLISEIHVHLSSNNSLFKIGFNDNLALIAIFASVYGGLCHREGLNTLIKQLLTEKNPLFQTNHFIHFELVFKAKNTPLNYHKGSESLTLQRWFPDKLTSVAIYNFLKFHKKKTTTTNLDDFDIWKYITSFWSSFNTPKVSSFSRFCKAASVVMIRSHYPNTPLFLISHMNSTLLSASMPLSSFQLFFNMATNKKYIPIKKNLRITRLKHHEKYNFSRCFNLPSSNEVEKWVNLIRNAVNPKTALCNKNNWPERFTKNLLSLLKDPSPIAVEILISRMLDKIEANRWKAISTPNSYISEIGEAWLNCAIYEQISEFDEDDSEFLYKKITQSIERFTEQKKLRTEDLFEYAAINFAITLPKTLQTDKVIRKNYVRSTIIPPHLYKQIRFDTNEALQHESSFYRTTIDLIIIIAFRCGLRPKEIFKLQLIDVDKNEDWLFIQKNKFGDNKTAQSKRKIPLKLLLNDDELKTFRQYINKRKLLHKTTNKALIFSKNASDDIQFNESELSTIFNYFANKHLILTDSPLYQCRHSFISNLMIMFFGCNELKSTFTDYRADFFDRLKNEFCGKSLLNELWQIAGAAGHLTPETTLRSYSHTCDLLLYSQTKNLELKQPINFWEKLCRMPTKVVREYKNDGIINLSDTYKFILPRLEKFVKKSSAPLKFTIGNNLPDFSCKTPTIYDCIDTLKLHDQGINNSTISEVLSIKSDIISKWLEVASDIKEFFKTTKKQYRLYPSTSNNLHPPMPQESDEIHHLHILQQHITPILTNNRRLTWCMSYMFFNVLATHSCIRFKNYKKLKDFINIIEEELPLPMKWVIKVKQEKKYMEIQLDDIKESQNGFIDAQLYYHIEGRANSSNQILQYLFHVNSIYIAGIEDEPVPNSHFVYLVTES